MKKLFSFILIISLLFVFSGCSQEKEFIFKEKIKWGMTVKEVIETEKSISKLEPNYETEGYLSYYDMPVSDYEVEMTYYFADGKLGVIQYQFHHSPIPDFSNLLQLYKSKYEETKETDEKRLEDVINSYTTLPSIDNLHHYSCGKTDIWLFMLLGDGSYPIAVYASPDYPDITSNNQNSKENATGI